MPNSKYRYAGVSNLNGDLKFHTSKRKRKMMVWIDLVDPTIDMVHSFIRLPRAMTKMEILRYLLKHPKFQAVRYQNLLLHEMECRKHNIAVRPRTDHNVVALRRVAA